MSEALRFWALAEAVGLAAAPLAAFLFARLPGGGLALSRPLALLVLAYPTWVLASLHLLPYGLPSAWIGIILLAALAAATWPRFLRALRSGDQPLRLQLWIAGEVLFTTGFFGWVLLRAYAPEVWQTEKPMDMAFINAINHSQWFPPHDPWMSGLPLNYYYFGHYLVAFLIGITGVAPTVGFNLGVAVFFALTLTSVYAVASALFAATKRAEDLLSWRPVAVGVTAAAFALLLGNLAGAGQLLGKPGPLGMFDWWSPSRVIPNTANEFPFFSFLLADLHPHVMATPFAMTALAIALQLAVAGPRSPLALPQQGKAIETIASAWFGPALELAMAGLVVGALYAVNSLDYPTSLGFVLMGLLLGMIASAAARWRLAVVWAAIFIASSVLFFLPFWLHFTPATGGLAIVGAHSGFRQFVHDYGLIYGLPLFVVGTALVLRLGRLGLKGRTLVWNAVPAIVLLVVLAPGHLTGIALLLGAFAVALHAAIFTDENQPHRFFWLLAAGAFGLLALSELVYIRDVFAGTPFYRFNTVFKLGYQAWFLFAIAAAVGVWTSRRWLSREAWPLLLGGVALLITAALVYPVAGTYSREGRFSNAPTLDGLGWLRIRAPGDVAAIEWLRAHDAPGEAILETVGPDYDPLGRARVSTYTGLPAVLGWAGHEIQWNHPPGSRFQDVRSIYSTSDVDEARRLLERYHVRYVFVGSLERMDYPSSSLDKFSQLGRLAFASQGTSIYQVG